MVLTYLGEGCFRLQSGETSLLVDPSGNRLKADVVLKTAVPDAQLQGESGVLSCAGEYELQRIEIEGVEVSEESSDKIIKTAYSLIWEDIKIAVLGEISATPSMKVLDKIGEPDVLILPVHEDHFLPPEEAAKLAKQLAPAVVVPSLYDKKSLEEFAKALGQKVTSEDRFTFKKKDLVPEAVTLIALTPKA
jgi:L-ascorbate metabolism protein UlaG (beta-lactamase superfamily)